MLRPLLLCLLLCATVLSKPTVRNKRVLHNDSSTRPEHRDDKNHDYDQQAFLGEDEAKLFQQLPLEESLRRLSIIVDRVDTDKDGLISEDELKVWIQQVQFNHSLDQAEARWKDYDRDGNGLIDWEEYQDTRRHENLEPEFNFSRVTVREERRFKFADANGDGSTDKREFAAFLHPEDHPHMREVLVQETLEEMDADGDGFIDMKEFIDDFHSQEGGEEFPEWVETERQHFAQTLDQNKDGRLGKQEVLDWILPPDAGYATSEAKHLVDKSDTDQDGKLSRSEVLKNHDMFVGSQVTNYGEALQQHDEF